METIKEYCINLISKYNTKRLQKITKNENKYNEILEYTKNFDNVPFSQRIFNIVYDIKDKPLCKVCNNEVKFHSYSVGYYNFCSNSCSMKDKDVRQKMKDTTIRIYGVENISQSKEIKNRKRETLYKNHGTYSVFDLSKEKIKYLYGVENISQSEIIKEKKKQKALEKYNVDNVFKSEEIKKDIIDSFLKNYGVENPQQNKEIKSKTRKTNELSGNWTPLELIDNFILYRRIVRRLTEIEYKNHKDIINTMNYNRDLEYHIDHKFSIRDGFINNILPNIIACRYNLIVINGIDNRKKGGKSSMTKKELFKLYESK